MSERIQKILSQWGIASRRQAEKLISEGRVRLNGKTVTLGQQADLTSDRLEIDGKLICPSARPQLIYLLLHKPQGVVSSCDDPQKRTTVMELLPKSLRQGRGIHPVGRLDLDSTGALLLTNDGDLTLGLTHPRYHLPKTYHVWIDGNPQEATLQKWREGVILMGKRTLPAKVTVLEHHRDRHHTLLEVILTEGRNRQIRRVVKQLGFHVLSLHRTAIGIIHLNGLDTGCYRYLNTSEINYLRKHVNLVLGQKEALYV